MPDDPQLRSPDQTRPWGRPTAWLVSALLFAGLTAAGFIAVSEVFTGTFPTFDARLIQPDALVLILVFLIVYFTSDGLRLYFVLRTIGVTVDFRDMIPLVFINILFSNVTPLATGGGLVQVWYMQRCRVPVGASMAATTIRTILAMLVIFVSAPLFHLLQPDAAPGGFAGVTMASLIGVIIFYLIGFLTVLLRPFWIVALVEGLFGLAARVGLLGPEKRARWTSAIRREASEFSARFTRFAKGSRRFALASILATLIFLLTLFAFPALLLSLLDYEVDWLAVIGALSVVTFLMYFAPTPGGAGFAELAFAGFMAGQMASDDLLFVIFVWRFLTIYLGMAIGVVVSIRAFRPGARS